MRIDASEALSPRGRGWISVVLALVAGLLPSTSALGQTYSWNQPTSGGDWLNASNWLPAGGPPNAAGTVAVFGNAIAGPNIGVALSLDVLIGELRFADVNTQSSTAYYTIGASARTIAFNNGGSDNLITVAGITLANQVVATGISVAGGQPLTINNNGAPGLTTLTLSGAMASLTAGTPLNVNGAANATISGTIGGSFGTLTKSGPGVLTLSSASNAYAGGTLINGVMVGTVINGGTVSVAADGNLGAASEGVMLNAGTLQFTNANFNTTRNFVLGAGGGTILSNAGDGNNNPTIGGVLSGSGRLTVDGGRYLSLSGSNSYTGPTVINNLGLVLTGGGRLSGTSAITINGFAGGQVGSLGLDNFGTQNNDRVNDAAPITLNGGVITGGAGLFGSASENLGSLTVKGFGSLFGTQLAGGFGTGGVTFASIARADNFSTLYVGGPISGPASAGVNFQIVFTSGLGATGGSGITAVVVPWIGGDPGDPSSGIIQPTGMASTLFTYDAANGLRALDPTSGTDYIQIANKGKINGAVTPNTAKNNALTGDPADVNSSVTILSLVQNPSSTASSTISGTGTLTVSSGAIANVNQLVFSGPTLNFGTNTGYIYLGNEFAITDPSRITGSNGLVVSSDAGDNNNTLYLINTANPNAFTGGLYLNGTARVAFDTSDSQLGAAGEVISFRGGTLRYIGSGPVILATSGINRPLQMTAAGGGAINVEVAAGILTVPGLISGTEQLTKIGPGTLILSNPSNTYQGGTTLNGGILTLGGAGSLGTGDLGIGLDGTAGSTLRFNFAGTYAGNINHAASATFDTNTNNVTLSGVVSGNGATLTKAGGGTLTLTAANTYSSNTVVGNGTLMVNNPTGSGTGFGSVAVSPGAGLGGTGTVGGPVTVTGGNLIVGPGTGPGQLTFRGPATLNSSSTFQSILAGSTAGTGYSQLVILPGGSINLGGAALNLTLSYAPANKDKLFLIDNQNTNPAAGPTGTFNGLANGQTVTFLNGTTAQISYFGDFGGNTISGGNDVVLSNFVPVPEPTGVLVFAAGLAGFARFRRR